MRDIRYQIAVNKQPDNRLTEDAAEIEVQQSIEGPTTFRVKFALDICQGEFDLLEDDRLVPGPKDTEITVMATLDNIREVLAHGIITERKVNLAEGGAGSALELICHDRRRIMDREQKSKAHQGTAAHIAGEILAGYGFDPDVGQTEIHYAENKTTLNQATETDLAFLNRLAGQNGLRLWIDWEPAPGPTGFPLVEKAHFRDSPPRPSRSRMGIVVATVLAPTGTAELKLNAGDGCSNVASFELHTNAETPTQTGPIQRVSSEDGQVAETSVTEPTTDKLGKQAATTREPVTRQLSTPGDTQEGRVRNEAAINDASWSVQATAETSVQALNAIVAPHQVIKVSGAGRLDSGNYFVKAVTHTIDSAAHKMRIELLRNALGA